MTPRRCAYLTMENLEGWSIDAELGFPPLRALGWTIDVLPWRSANVDWDSFDAVYIGTPWDYPDDPQLFLRILGSIDRSSAVLVNDYRLVSWSMPKTYLRDLERRGVAVVPSRWPDKLDAGELDEAFEEFGAQRIIVKPVISTNAANTFLLERNVSPEILDQLQNTFAGRPCMIQPFIENICGDGEYSLFYFSRRFSHAIRKVPRRGDFRVQEEHGADITAIEPEAALRHVADELLQLVDPQPVYARADFVRGMDDRFLLMELELVEPSMYLRMDENAPRRFAEAFDEYYRQIPRETCER